MVFNTVSSHNCFRTVGAAIRQSATRTTHDLSNFFMVCPRSSVFESATWFPQTTLGKLASRLLSLSPKSQLPNDSSALRVSHPNLSRSHAACPPSEFGTRRSPFCPFQVRKPLLSLASNSSTCTFVSQLAEIVSVTKGSAIGLHVPKDGVALVLAIPMLCNQRRVVATDVV